LRHSDIVLKAEPDTQVQFGLHLRSISLK